MQAIKNMFVTSVEAGVLEEQCVRMAESIRRHGGEGHVTRSSR